MDLQTFTKSNDLNAINASGREAQWDVLHDCLTDYEADEKEGFTTLLVTRIHCIDECNEIDAWLAERKALINTDCLPMIDETLETSAYLFKDENLALEFRMRWS